MQNKVEADAPERAAGLIHCENHAVLDISLEPVAVTSDRLNNFFCNLPGGFYRSPLIIEYAFREGESFITAWSRYYKEKNKPHNVEELKGYSKKKLLKTPDAFFNDVDAALEKCNINRDTVKGLVLELNSAATTGDTRRDALKKLFELVLPAYLMLRAAGYSHRDLVG